MANHRRRRALLRLLCLALALLPSRSLRWGRCGAPLLAGRPRRGSSLPRWGAPQEREAAVQRKRAPELLSADFLGGADAGAGAGAGAEGAGGTEAYLLGDTVQSHRSSLQNASQSASTWDLHFLGTASCIPTRSRGVSSTLLRAEHCSFMFDCGEGTQMAIQEAPFKLSKITHVFLSHLHGDHVFGLPGLLCLLAPRGAPSPRRRRCRRSRSSAPPARARTCAARCRSR